MASLVEEPLGGADGERKALLNLESGECCQYNIKWRLVW